MTDALTWSDPRQEAKFIKERKLGVALVEVLAGVREGTPAEKRRLETIAAEAGEALWVEAVYMLTHRALGAVQAKKTFDEIVAHRRRLSHALRRPASLQVAALDYMQGILGVLKNPTIIDEDKAVDLAGRSITDETTKAYDVNLLASDIDAEIERGSKRFSVVFIDVDDLKKINDAYGRSMGNKILEYMTEIVRRGMRKTDTIYRYGGDEFAILMPGASSKAAREWAARLRRTLSRLRTDGKLPPEVSVGIATYGASGVNDRQTLLYAGDKALSLAKKGGKDRVVVYDRHGRALKEAAGIEHEKKHAPESRRFTLSGAPVAPGLAIGSVFHYRDIMTAEFEVRDLGPAELKDEIKRVRSAMQLVREDLGRMKQSVKREISSKHAAIFDVHQTILDDADLWKEIERELRDRMINAEQVVRDVFRKWEKRLKNADSELMQERANDIADVARSILGSLTGVNVNVLSDIPAGSVIFAKRLLPSDTVNLNAARTRAIVTLEGGRSSHSAILSKGMEVPSVSKIATPLERVPAGARAIVDGDTGRVIVNPTPAEIRRAEAKIRAKKAQTVRLAASAKRLAAKSGFTVCANVSSPHDVELAARYGADGIGLYRIEQLYMMSRTLPAEAHLVRELARILKPMKAKPVTVRLLDIGGDKTLPYLEITDKDSLLGLRGVRLLLKYRTLLETQIDVLLSLSAAYDVRMLVPMVSLAHEMNDVRAVLESRKERMRKKGAKFDAKMPLGAMIETPSAVFTIDEILKASDFVSIGTNDLVQYTMAADREKLSVSSYYEAGSRVILPGLRDIAAKARAAGVECAICGELGGDVDFTSELVAAGLTRFSVAPSTIPPLRRALAGLIK